MCKKLIFLMSFVLVLGLVLSNTAEAADPDLVGWWKFDEDSGTTALDSSGRGNDGTLVNEPVWQPTGGQIDGALQFDGTDDYVSAPHIPFNSRSFTIMMWIKPVWDTDDEVVFAQEQEGSENLSMHFRLNYRTGPPAEGRVRMGFYANDLDTPWGPVADNTWYHVTFWYDFENPTSPTRRVYLNGVQVAQDNGAPYLGTSGDTHIGIWNTDQWFGGMIDDVRVYHRALTETEIGRIMLGEGNYEAHDPAPADGAEDVSIETNLTWTRGDGPPKWDLVYFGTDPCQANLPQVAYREVGIEPALYNPGDPNLRASTTYYWYVAEVNSADPCSPYISPVWSFTTVSGYAQCEYPENGTLITGDVYYPNPDYLYTEMTFFMGVTAVKHTGYLSTNRDDVVGRAPDANLGPPPKAEYGGRFERLYYAGRPDYPPFESLIRGEVYYWTVDETDAFGNVFPGDIWWFAVQPYYAFEPSPPNEAIYMDPDVELSWLEGYGAQYHDVFMGTSWEDVNNAYFTFPIVDSSPEYIDTTNPGVTYFQCSGLPTDTKLYWRIDESVGRDPPWPGIIQKGRVWEFTTRGPIAGLAGEYYHWVDPSATGGGGDPGPIEPFQSKVLVRIDPNIDFNWDTGSPDPSVRTDDFSVRWTGQIAVPTKGEVYTFTTQTDDGIRLWVNDQLIIDQWIAQGPTFWSGDILLDNYGPYNIEMDYYERGVGAVARLFWQSSSTAYGLIPSNFLSPNLEAFTPYGPDPLDDALVLNWEPTLRWGPALLADTHNLYLSTDFNNVNERNVAALEATIDMDDPCYPSPRLFLNQTYYWAVDGVNTHPVSPWESEVWSFTIPPGGTGSIIREWWLGIDGAVVANLTNNWRYPDYPDGRDFITTFEFPPPPYPPDNDWANDYGTRLHGWLRPPTTGDYRFWLATDDGGELNLSTDEDPANAVRIAWVNGWCPPRDWDNTAGSDEPNQASGWITLEAGKKYYIAGLMKEDGGGDNIAAAWVGPATSPIPEREVIDGEYLSLTPHDPPEAYGEYPANGATGIQDRNPVLSWKPGFYDQEQATVHELYFSPTLADVCDRNPGIKLILDEPNYPVPAPPLQLERTYYWAVDEVYSGPIVFEGQIWSFTMAPCMTLDNMEDYNDRGEIRRVWIDGYASVAWGGSHGYEYPRNTANSGSNLNTSTEVGSPYQTGDDPPVLIPGPIYGGLQSMVLSYDNDGHTYPLLGEERWDYDAENFSEIEANTVENLDVGTTWFSEGVKSLTLWFQGHPISDGSVDFDRWFTTPYAEYSITGRGRDIQGGHDEFYFFAMYPWVLSGATDHIQTRVVRMDNTNGWAKAGIMMREKLTPSSRYAAVFVTPNNGVTFQWRLTEGGTTGFATDSANSTWDRPLEPPIYLKLERTDTAIFKASYSNNSDWGWEDVNVVEDEAGDITSMTVPMDDPNVLYAGAVVSSGDGSQLCVTDFNNWAASPWPDPQDWIFDNVGLNDPEQLYIALSDGTTTAVIEHEDPNAATLTSWQEWDIDLEDFNDLGLNLSNITKVYVGLGDRVTHPDPGGSGAIYVDDIQACPPKCVPSKKKPDYDIAGPDGVGEYDCIVNEYDLRVLAFDWLDRDELIDTQAPSDSNLIARYTFDTDYTDSIGGFNLDPNGTVQIVSDPVRGGVLDLSGSGYLHSGHNAVDLGIDGNTPRTFSCWAYTRQYNEAGLYEIGQHVDGQDWSLRTTATVDLWRTQQWGTYNVHDFDFSYPSEDVWVHFAHVYDSNEVKVYANGKHVGTLKVNLNTGGSPKNLHVGNWNNYLFNGMVDDLRIYDYGLSQAEAAYIAAEGAGTLHIPILSDAEVYKGEAPGSQWINLKDYNLIASKYLEEILWP